MSMLTSISGFPEWLPEDRLVEQAFVDLIRKKFELYGFAPIETRAIEPLPVILAKGETDHEIYVLRRLQASDEENGKVTGDQEVALHFDLTIPFARYVVENRGKLQFPFRRYQIQKAWRGERPGLGRYREFLQADFDIIGENRLSISNDVEVIQTINEIVAELPIPPVRIQLNNRKILEGFYRGMRIPEENIHAVLRSVDKLDKVGEEHTFQQLTGSLRILPETARKCIQLGQIKGQDSTRVINAVRSLEASHTLLEEGLEELSLVLDACRQQPGNSVVADLSIARGLDYYTGTVCEARFVQFPQYPSLLGGGRYDRLANTGSTQFPGVGLTIGITRILGLVLHEGLLRASRKTPTCVLIALVSEPLRSRSIEIARILRSREIPCELFPEAARYGKQIAYAEKKGIPYVWFPSESGENWGEVRDLRSRSQEPANPQEWTPPEEDRAVTVFRDEEASQSLVRKSEEPVSPTLRTKAG
jgi:histidyl-tRNA synthetase